MFSARPCHAGKPVYVLSSLYRKFNRKLLGCGYLHVIQAHMGGPNGVCISVPFLHCVHTSVYKVLAENVMNNV